MRLSPLVSLIFFKLYYTLDVIDLQNRGSLEVDDEDSEPEEKEDSAPGGNVYNFLYKRMKQDFQLKKKLPAEVYAIPGPQEPLPGRSHSGDYWPVFPFQNQFSGGVDLDPSISRHIGGDMNIAVPSWGILDIYGRFFNRIHDTTTKFGYVNYPVNMLDLDKSDFVQLMSDPRFAHNRNLHPTLPLAKLAKSYVPMSCKPPMCNPYHMNFGLGIEHDYGGNDGVEGDIDVAMPISKGVAYRFPISGNIYAARENITITYGHNVAPVDPIHSLFDYKNHRDAATNNLIPRRWTRSVDWEQMSSENRHASSPSEFYQLYQRESQIHQNFLHKYQEWLNAYYTPLDTLNYYYYNDHNLYL